jgi:hypothetical protein
MPCSCPRYYFPIYFQRVIVFIYVFICFFESLQKNFLITTLIKLAKELIKFVEHELIVVGLDEFSEIFFIKLSLEVLKLLKDVIIECKSAFIEIIFELEKYSSWFSTESIELFNLHLIRTNLIIIILSSQYMILGCCLSWVFNGLPWVYYRVFL